MTKTHWPVGRYLKYAIGEILLVVIGILIALQINNWNEYRKNKNEEFKILTQIKSDLLENEKELKDVTKRLQINSWAMDSLLYRINKPDSNPKIAVYTALILRKSYFNVSNSGYKIITNGRLNLISNDLLLNKILQLYEKDFANIKTRESLMNDKIENKILPHTNKLFKINPNLKIRLKALDVTTTEVYNPIDINALSNDHKYLNTLYQLRKTFNSRLIYLNETDRNLLDAIKLLNEELDTFN